MAECPHTMLWVSPTSSDITATSKLVTFKGHNFVIVDSKFFLVNEITEPCSIFMGNQVINPSIACLTLFNPLFLVLNHNTLEPIDLNISHERLAIIMDFELISGEYYYKLNSEKAKAWLAGTYLADLEKKHLELVEYLIPPSLLPKKEELKYFEPLKPATTAEPTAKKEKVTKKQKVAVQKNKISNFFTKK